MCSYIPLYQVLRYQDPFLITFLHLNIYKIISNSHIPHYYIMVADPRNEAPKD